MANFIVKKLHSWFSIGFALCTDYKHNIYFVTRSHKFVNLDTWKTFAEMYYISMVDSKSMPAKKVCIEWD